MKRQASKEKGTIKKQSFVRSNKIMGESNNIIQILKKGGIIFHKVEIKIKLEKM